LTCKAAAGPDTMTCMDPTWWPLAQLRLQTPRLELRVPSEDDLHELAGVAAAGVHEPSVQPFAFPWTDVAPEERARSTLQYHWTQWGAFKPEHWTLDFVVVHEGAVVGTQGVSAHDFAVLREVHTGSWLGLARQGKGIGTEMRAAVLHLAFAGLGAEYAMSRAFTDNAASLAVSRKLGYAEDGIEFQVSRGRPASTQRLRLDRATWLASGVGRFGPVTITGLEPCLSMFGLSAASAPHDEAKDDEHQP
jgi:RimJ/RimL family protein N-acetyltransferase